LTLLIDNDIVLKLAQLDLLDSATPLLNGKYGDLQVLRTLRYKFCPNNEVKRARLAKKYTKDILTRLMAFIDMHVSEVDCEVTDASLINAMASSDDGLDIGEMQLLQALIESDESSMFTGDKRFLRALANDHNVVVHSDKLNQSFICFEQIIIFLINELGFDFVKHKYILALKAGLSIDTTLRMCFEGQELAEEQRVTENLSVHVGYLKVTTESLLSTSDDWSTKFLPSEKLASPILVSF